MDTKQQEDFSQYEPGAGAGQAGTPAARELEQEAVQHDANHPGNADNAAGMDGNGRKAGGQPSATDQGQA